VNQTFLTPNTPLRCGVCGGLAFSFNSVLWPELINDWQLSQHEIDYIDHQQGQTCDACGSNLRSSVLATAITRALGQSGFLANLSGPQSLDALRTLEINEAGTLTKYLRKIGRHVYCDYPSVDIHNLPYGNDTFDLVVHSDTLEHVQNPVHALAECRRVIRPGGALCFTVPVVVGRMSRSREGMKKSYHGNPECPREDYQVHTEFGADTWTYLFEAGFSEISIHSVDYPTALAFSARK
jgi:SAM-dependent methyltransferase